MPGTVSNDWRGCRYQGWGTSPGQTSYAGYGAAGAGAGPGNYQGWGAPPAPQAPPHAPAWPATNNYAQHTQPPAQGYSSYGNYHARLSRRRSPSIYRVLPLVKSVLHHWLQTGNNRRFPDDRCNGTTPLPHVKQMLFNNSSHLSRTKYLEAVRSLKSQIHVDTKIPRPVED